MITFNLMFKGSNDFMVVMRIEKNFSYYTNDGSLGHFSV